MIDMKTSKQGMIELAGHEGICLTKYKDSVGVWTIGVGATKSEIPDLASWPMDKSLKMSEVFDLFKKSLVKYETAINKAINVKLTQEEYDALSSICYNIGTGWFGAGGHAKATFVNRINSGARAFFGDILDLSSALRMVQEDFKPTTNCQLVGTEYEEEPELGFVTSSVVEAIMRFTKPKEITGRRKKEARLFATGNYSNGGKAILFPVSAMGNPRYAAGKTINVEDYL